MLRLLCLLILAAPAAADEPAKKDPAVEAVISDLIELREQVGGATDSGDEGFAEAMRGVLRDAPRSQQQAAPPLAEPFRHSFPAPHQYRNGFAGSTAPGPQSPVVKLRLKAFDLDRVAHELEMANLGAEADAVREAAQTLRTAARGLVKAKKPAAVRPKQPRQGFQRLPSR